MKGGLKYFLAFLLLAIIQKLMREQGYGSPIQIALITLPFTYYTFIRASETKNSKIASTLLALLTFFPFVSIIVVLVLTFSDRDKRLDKKKNDS